MGSRGIRKIKKAPTSNTKSDELIERLTAELYQELLEAPPCFAESTMKCVDNVWKMFSRFCREKFEAGHTKFFPSPEPIQCCQNITFQVVRLFLAWYCAEHKETLTKASSLFTMSKVWRQGFHYHMRREVPLHIKTDMKNTIFNELIPKFNLSQEGSPRGNMNVDDFMSLCHHYWVLSDEYYAAESERLDHYTVLVFCGSTTARAGTVVESAGYHGTNAAWSYRDVVLYVMRDPDNPGEVIIGAWIVLRLLKGRREKGHPPIIKIVERRDAPNYCLILLIVAYALRDGAFSSPHISSLDDIYKVNIPARRKALPLHWRSKWMDTPILRQVVRTEGARVAVSPTRALAYSQVRSWTTRLGRSWGSEHNLELKMLRRGVGGAVDKFAKSGQRNQLMGHKNDGIFERSYRNDIVDADVQSAFLEKPANEELMRLMGHLSLNRDTAAPTTLTSAQRQEAKQDLDVQTAKLRREEQSRLIKNEYGSITAAQALSLEEEYEATKMVLEYEERKRRYYRLLRKKENELLEHLRIQYFATIGDVCIANQHMDKPEPTAPQAVIFRLEERNALAELLFPPAGHENRPIKEILSDRCRIVANYVSLSKRRDTTAPSKRRAARDPSPSDDSTLPFVNDCKLITPCFVDTNPEHCPVKVPGTKCLFCLGDSTLAPPNRVYNYSSSTTLTRHVYAQHLDFFLPEACIPCGHPLCQAKEFQCNTVGHFMAHALTEHNIAHCVRQSNSIGRRTIVT